MRGHRQDTPGSDTSDSDGDVPQVGEADDWEDWAEGEAGGGDDDMGEQSCKCLFSDTTFPSAEEAFDNDKATRGFDLREFARQHSLTDYDCIKCVNFIRAEVRDGRDPLPELQALCGPLSGSPDTPYSSDKWLSPVLEDDGLMFFDFQLEEDEPAGLYDYRGSGLEQPGVGATVDAQVCPSDSAALRLRELEQENRALKEALEGLRWSVLPGELKEEAAASTSKNRPGKQTAKAEEHDRVDKTYFDSYSYFDIHREMLGDRHRTETYKQALEENPSAIRGKTVLDVGCGTGILAMFAARAGASAVVGVDGSERIAKFARQNIELNGLGSTISVVTGKVEELSELPVDGAHGGWVDVIVSEWMGYALLFETMLDSVFVARDKWLKPGGVMFPDRATIFVAAGGKHSTGISFWHDVYGFDMAPIAEESLAGAMTGAIVRDVRSTDVLTPGTSVKEWDLLTATTADLNFTSDFRLDLQGSAEGEQCASVVLWFDTPFSSRVCPDHPVVLTTSPMAKPTHWAQTVLPLRRPVAVGPTSGVVAVAGRVSFAAREGETRSLDIALECWPEMEGGAKGPAQSAIYNMGVRGTSG